MHAFLKGTITDPLTSGTAADRNGDQCCKELLIPEWWRGFAHRADEGRAWAEQDQARVKNWKASPSKRPKSLIFRWGITNRAMKESVM